MASYAVSSKRFSLSDFNRSKRLCTWINDWNWSFFVCSWMVPTSLWVPLGRRWCGQPVRILVYFLDLSSIGIQGNIIVMFLQATLPSERFTWMSILPLFSECLAIDLGDLWYQYTNLLIVSTASGGRAVTGKAWLKSASTPAKWTPVSFMIK